MAKCPNCGSRNTSWCNPAEVVGANMAGIVAGCVMSCISPNSAPMAQYRASRNLVEYKEYRCKDCGKDFRKNRWNGEVF